MIPRQKSNRHRTARDSERRRAAHSYEQKVKGVQSAIQARGKRPHSKFADYFHKFSHKTSEIVGSPWAFATSILAIVIWATLGPAFGFSDTWQLVINTGTTIVTFLMVFLIQNTQNRDARAIHLKLDELLHAAKGARNRLIDLEDMSEEELNNLQKEFERLRRETSRERNSEKEEGS